MSFKFLLTEDIASFRKRYPEIDDETFNMLLKLDPTYTGGDNKGSYSQWIMDLYKRIKKQGESRLRRFVDEDLYKVSDYLAEFDEKKKFFKNKDINQFKTLPDLAQALEEVGEGELSHRQEVRQRQKDRKNADLGKEAELVHEDSKWEVWVPKTYAASCKLGQGSSWCTASTESDNYYNHYLDMYGGKYYIIINKNDEDEKYQFHFESGQFMNKYDREIPLIKFLRDNEDLYEFFKPKILETLSESMDGYDMVDLDKSELASEASYRDLSKSFLMDVMHGELWSDFDFSEVEVSDSDFKLIDEKNRETILQIGGCSTIEECYNENDGIQDAVHRAVVDAYEVGSVNQCISDFIDALEQSLPAWAKLPNNFYTDDSSYIPIIIDKEYVKNNALDVLYELSEHSFEDVGLSHAMCEMIGNRLSRQFTEPSYGWNEFDVNAFNEILSDELYEISSDD